MPKLLVISEHAALYQDLLEAARLPGLDACFHTSAESARDDCGEAEILFGAPDRLLAALPYCPRLQWLQSSWAGIKPLLDCERRDYLLTGVKDLFGPTMTEYVLGWLLALERNIPTRVQARQWDDRSDATLLGKRLGIMGTGSIGSYVAKHCRPFGITVIGLNSDGREVGGFDRCWPTSQRLEFAQQLDYLAALLPDTPATDRLVDAELLNSLRPGAIVINGGRANSVDLDALQTALASGQLRHAVLDVLPVEPLSASDPLWQVPNLSITSHTAAPTPGHAIVDIFSANYLRFMAGQPLLHQIDFERGY